jgi:rubrerythrin
MKKIYVCDVCRFIFERVGETNDCPDCDSLAVREASEEERIEYLERRAE